MNDGNQNSHATQRATLDALVRKKFNIGRAHPVLVTQVLGTHTYAKVMPPILRCIQSEHSDILVESPLLIHTEGLTEEMASWHNLSTISGDYLRSYPLKSTQKENTRTSKYSC